VVALHWPANRSVVIRAINQPANKFFNKSTALTEKFRVARRMHNRSFHCVLFTMLFDEKENFYLRVEFCGAPEPALPELGGESKTLKGMLWEFCS